MATNKQLRLGKLSLLAITFICSGIGIFPFENRSLAQIVPDDTLGSEQSVVTPENINGIDSDKITGGAARGGNLFHSFQDFNVNEEKGAYFDNPAAIQNIFSRVTGNNPSEILGTMGVLGAANLYFINPNGILFGENASLDLEGSFFATTADSILFPDGDRFSALNPDAPPLLTVDVEQPVGLELKGENGNITHRGNLEVDTGKNLALVGGDITLDAGSIVAPGGKVDLGSLAGVGIIAIDNSNFSFPDDVARGNITLTKVAIVDVTAGGGGSIAVNANNLSMSEESQLLAGIQEGSELSDTQPGDIVINATDTINLTGSDSLGQRSSIKNNVQLGAIGEGGNIVIKTGSLSVEEGAELNTSTFGRGNAGNIIIDAGEVVKFVSGKGEGSSFASSKVIGEVKSGAEGQGGKIDIKAEKLSLTDGAFLSVGSRGKGNAGSVSLEAHGEVEFDGVGLDGFPSGAYSRISSETEGQGGRINILADKLLVVNGAQVSSGTFGIDSRGDGGNLTINATDSVEVIGEAKDIPEFSRLTTRTEGSGDAGNLNINAKNFIIRDGAQVSSGTFGIDSQGDGGNLTINAADSVKILGESSIYPKVQSRLTTRTEGSGDAGNLNINAKNFIIQDGAQVSSGTTSASIGNGENLTVTISNLLEISGESKNAAVFSRLTSRTRGKGDAKDLTINTQKLVIKDGGQISADTFFGSTGLAGNLTVNASEFIKVIGTAKDNFPSSLSSKTTSNEAAGDIRINTPQLIIDRGASISASTEIGTSGNSGTITVNALQEIVINNSSELTVETDNAGNPGDIFITTPNLIIGKDSQLSATTTENSTNKEGGGSITLNISNLDLTGKLGIFAETQGVSPAGTLDIQPYTEQSDLNIAFTDTAILSTQTLASGAGGDISLTAPESINISGDGKISTETTGSGQAGDINIITKDLNISDLTEISASTDGLGEAGNIIITTDNLNLARRARIFTDTEGSLPGGNINLDIADVLTLRSNSQIAAEAGNEQAGGNGGNINIDAPFIIALPNENSDITANAFTGNGGRVEIASQGIFGIEFRDQATALSDITASSEFGQAGEVEIDTSAVDPTRNLDSLPQQVIESEVAQSCQERGSQTILEFFDIGRGGLPPTPEDLVSGDGIIADWIPLDIEAANLDLSDLTQKEDSQVTSSNIFPCQDAQS